MNIHLSHLILGPGGMKGVYYIGVMRYLYIENLYNNIKYIAGTSVGSFFVIALALRMPVEYLEKRFLNLIQVKDEFNINLSFSSIKQMIEKKGVFELDFLIDIIKDYLEDKYQIQDITFLDFVKKTGIFVYISSSCVNTKQNQTFSFENTPDVSILDAVRASMACPLLFAPVLIKNKLYVDGILSFQYNVDNFFTDVSNDNKLYINISETQKNNISTIPKNENINFITYLTRTIKISYTHATNTRYDKNQKCVLHCDTLSNGSFDYTINDNNVEFLFNEQDFNSIILQGFIDTSQHFKKRIDNTK